MASSSETGFIPPSIEKTPFANTTVQNFFAEWCRINDSIIPEFISREEWQQRGVQGILEKNDQGKQTLFLPTDLHLWEMMDVIKTIDSDTFARNPKKRAERANQIQELGVTFEKAGMYLSDYLPNLDDESARQIAENLAQQFYDYGLSLQHKKLEATDIPEESLLTEEDKAKLDEWFLGKEVYQKRLARLGENPSEDQIEDTRKKLFQVYFNALSRKGYKAAVEMSGETKKDGNKPDEEKPKPWDIIVGPMQHLQDRTRGQITNAIETPEREMKTAIFRRGVEKLVTEMKTPHWRESIQTFLSVGCDLDLATEEVKLINTLRLNNLRNELESIRQTGDLAQISAKELEIAQTIQQAVSSFPYKLVDEETKELIGNNPSKMVETGFVNCVGSSMLGGGLLGKMGIKYLHALIPEHSTTVLVTSDGKVYWQDFTPPGGLEENYTEITPEMVDGEVDLSNILEGGTSLNFKEWNPYLHQPRNFTIKLSQPEIGLQCQVLNNTGYALLALGRREEAIEAYKLAISLDQKFTYPYNGLGNALYDLGRNEEAIEAFKQAICLDPENPNPYNGLGNALNALYQHEKAIDAFKQAICLDPENPDPYNGLGNALNALYQHEKAIDAYKQAISLNPEIPNPYDGLGNALYDLGRNEEAIVAYQQFIELWTGDQKWIDRAKKHIERLQK